MSGAEEAGIDSTLPVILLFIFFGVIVRQVRKALPTWFKLPYTVLMFLFGVLFTALATEFHGSWGRVGRSVDLWLGVHPHIILLVFLPPLLFESAFDMDYNVFQRVAGQALLLAVPGVFLSLGLTACYVKFMFSRCVAAQGGGGGGVVCVVVVVCVAVCVVRVRVRVRGACAWWCACVLKG